MPSKIEFTARIGSSPEFLDKTSLIFSLKIFSFSPGIFLIFSCALSKILTVKVLGKNEKYLKKLRDIWKIFENIEKYLKNI